MQGNSIAERHYDIEDDRRSAKQLAKHINDILRREKPDGWSFAAPAEIQQAVVSEVKPGLREQLLACVPQDLVNVPPNQLLEHFSTAPAS